MISFDYAYYCSTTHVASHVETTEKMLGASCILFFSIQLQCSQTKECFSRKGKSKLVFTYVLEKL